MTYTPPERGPIQTFEVTWNNGHVERIEAHQVSHPGSFTMFGDQPRRPKYEFHGEFDGHWTLVLSVLEDEVRTVRNVTRTEQAS